MPTRKFLFTLPSGNTPPSVADLPQGYPFVDTSTDPPTLRVLVDGAFVAAGSAGSGGGGGGGGSAPALAPYDLFTSASVPGDGSSWTVKTITVPTLDTTRGLFVVGAIVVDAQAGGSLTLSLPNGPFSVSKVVALDASPDGQFVDFSLLTPVSSAGPVDLTATYTAPGGASDTAMLNVTGFAYIP